MRDATIIGAGPAGCAAAVVLARRGWDVTLVEQHRFPRDKVCGECLSALGMDVLDRLGVAAEFLRAGATRFDHTAVFAPGGRSFTARLPRPMWGLSRSAFDTLLLDAACAAGAVIRQPARCEAVGAARAPTEVRIRDLVTNRIDTLRPAFVLAAGGRPAPSQRPPAATGDLGLKAHFANVDGPRDTIELFATRGRYGGLAAIEGGRWNAAFSVSADRVRASRGDLDGLFAHLVAGNPALAHRLAGTRRVSDWLASPLPRFAVNTEPDGPPAVLPVGNAAAALEPIGGEGMGLALRSGELAATAIAERNGEWTDRDRRRLLGEYHCLWRTRRAACRAAACAVTSPVAGALLRLVRDEPPGLGVALRLMGKGRGSGS